MKFLKDLIIIRTRTFYRAREALKFTDGGFVEIFTGPNRKNHKAHEKTNSATCGYSVEPIVCYGYHTVHSIARNRYEIERQEEDHNSVIVILLYIRYKSYICCSRSCNNLQR